MTVVKLKVLRVDQLKNGESYTSRPGICGWVRTPAPSEEGRTLILDFFADDYLPPGVKVDWDYGDQT